MTATTKVHVLVFPYPAQGHMLPLLDLTHQLATRGVVITILVTPKNLPILEPILSKHNSIIKTLVLPFPSHPSIPPGFENVKDLPIQSFISMMCSLRELHDPIVAWFRSHPDPPAAIISDMFLGWTHQLANELGVPRIQFSPSGASALSVINWLWRHMPKRDDPDDENHVVSFPEVQIVRRGRPGFGIYQRRVLGESGELGTRGELVHRVGAGLFGVFEDGLGARPGLGRWAVASS